MENIDNKIINKLKYLVNKGKSLEEIYFALDITEFEMTLLLRELKSRGEKYDIIDGKIINNASVVKKENCYDLTLKNPTKICLLSDLHLGSSFDRVDVLKDIYQNCADREIEAIFCAGDLTDGYYPHLQSIDHNQRVHGFDNTKEYVINELPYNKNIKFYTIAGNHDITYKNHFDMDIVDEIAKKRDDIIYLGEDTANINLNNKKFRIHHGNGGNGLDLYKRISRYYETIPEDDKPDILQLGHIHRSFHAKISNTEIYQCASLMDSSIYAQKNGFPEEISAYYVDLSINKARRLKLSYTKEKYDQSQNRKNYND